MAVCSGASFRMYVTFKLLWSLPAVQHAHVHGLAAMCAHHGIESASRPVYSRSLCVCACFMKAQPCMQQLRLPQGRPADASFLCRVPVRDAGVHSLAAASRAHHGAGSPSRRPFESRLSDRHQEDLSSVHLL